MPGQTPLPIDDHLSSIISTLRKTRAIVVVAEPGAGKTTQIPPAVLAAEFLGKEHSNLVMLQPRRVAARAAAQRIADENDWQLGGEVGYHIRFEKRLGPKTRLRVLTEGILTRQLLSDPFLEGVGGVILDEFHERSLHTDLAVAMLRELRQTVRPDLCLVIMSATMDAEKAAAFLGDCPIVRVPGRTFPIDISYRPHAAVSLVDRVAEAVLDELEHDRGDILTFLPGAPEIQRVEQRLARHAAGSEVQILPLHGSLPPDRQMLALRPSQKRKVILATNIAETSLTIEGVRVVIDAGLARVPLFDPQRGLDRLELKRISKASAAQRAGRAGRTAPGRCVRLWSEKEQGSLDDFESPEIMRVDLCQAILDVYAWGKSDANEFGWFETPPQRAVDSAKRLLTSLGAIESNRLTSIGKRLMKLPAHPRIGRLLLAASHAGCPREGAMLAALLSEKDIVRFDRDSPRGPKTQGDSDLLIRLDLLQNSARNDSGLDPAAVRAVLSSAREFERLANRLTDSAARTPTTQTLLKLPLLAYPDRVCRRRASDPAAAAMVGGGGVRLAPESAVRKSEFFLALDARDDLRMANREALVQIASAIHPEWLSELFPQSILRERTLEYDEPKQRIVGRRIERYLDLVLSEQIDSAIDPREAGEALAAALRPRAAEIFAADPAAANLIFRVALLRRSMPEHPWPKFDADQLGDVLADCCQNRKSLVEVQRASLAEALKSRLAYPLDRLFDRHAPRDLPVPSGSRIELDYTGRQPVLAVRLQEIFGWTDTPRIADGRVAVLLHLLGPNFRPVQITDDLKSFWSTAYFQVRKDLRVRYPKHSWPENPLTAIPQAKGRRPGPRR